MQLLQCPVFCIMNIFYFMNICVGMFFFFLVGISTRQRYRSHPFILTSSSLSPPHIAAASSSLSPHIAAASSSFFTPASR